MEAVESKLFNISCNYALPREIVSMTATTTFQLRPGALIAEFDTSTQSKTYRVELPTGTHFQVKAGIYQLLACLHTPLSLNELTVAFQERTGQPVTSEQLAPVVDQLSKNGFIVRPGEASEPINAPTSKLDTYLGLHFRRDLIPARYLAWVSAPLDIFFKPIVAVALLMLTTAAHLWTYVYLGFPPDLNVVDISWPLLYIVMTASMLFHELGHLAACHHYKCPHGPLGVAIYMLTPAVYVNVTAAWRLPRWSRAVVDIGGLYFQLLCVPLFVLLFWWTNDSTWLFIIVLTDLVILDNFEPFMKLDGYWLLSDLTGVPNLHARAAEFVKYYIGWLRWRFGKLVTPPQLSSFSQWSPKVRWIILGYTLISLVVWPLLILAMLPLLLQALMAYPSLWYAALIAAGEAIHTGNLATLWEQAEVLFLPTVMLANLAFLVKISLERRRNARLGQASA
jgi:putative peptide zinc metalloprotease protein